MDWCIASCSPRNHLKDTPRNCARVIPEEIGKRLGWKEGSQFVVVGERDAEFDDLIAEARREARKAALKRTDVRDAIRTARDRE